MSQQLDLLTTLLAIDAGSSLAAARQFRLEATNYSQAAYNAIFRVEAQSAVSLPLRYALAAYCAELEQNSLLQQHYKPLAAKLDLTQYPRLRDFAGDLMQQPNQVRREQLVALTAEGWSVDDIVLLAQLMGYVSFQSRLAYGFKLLLSKVEDNAAVVNSAPAAAWNQATTTFDARAAPSAFTLENLGWQPWLPAKSKAELSEQQQENMRKYSQLDFPYFMLLARNAEVLLQRTLIDRAIFYTAGGLAKVERELAAAAVSKVNGCIFCASVHAGKAAQLSKRHAEITRLLATPAQQPLRQAVTEPRWQALIDFAASLSTVPSSASQGQLQQLRQLGLDEIQLLDLIQASAFFAWANRLMLTLGEPYLSQTSE